MDNLVAIISIKVSFPSYPVNLGLGVKTSNKRWFGCKVGYPHELGRHCYSVSGCYLNVFFGVFDTHRYPLVCNICVVRRLHRYPSLTSDYGVSQALSGVTDSKRPLGYIHLSSRLNQSSAVTRTVQAMTKCFRSRVFRHNDVR